MSEIKYAEDKPKDCKYCYWWGGRKKVLCAGTFIQVLLEEANSGLKKIIRA